MREILARLACLLTVGLVVALAHVFAARHNPARPSGGDLTPPPTKAAPASNPSEAARGREVYAAQNCSTCHAIAGVGNPRIRLDGVGARRTRSELREWVTGTGSATEQLSPAVRRRKQRYQSLPPEELAALVAYLSTLTAEK